jgi:hypothetical protein
MLQIAGTVRLYPLRYVSKSGANRAAGSKWTLLLKLNGLYPYSDIYPSARVASGTNNQMDCYNSPFGALG